MTVFSQIFFHETSNISDFDSHRLHLWPRTARAEGHAARPVAKFEVPFVRRGNPRPTVSRR
jgi:hypothetical protein